MLRVTTVGIFRLPAGHFLGMLRVLEVDDAQRSGGIVGEIDVVAIDVSAVHAAAHGRGVFGKHLEMRGVGGIEEHDTVFAVRSPFAGEDADFLVGRGADVVDEARIDFERVEQFGTRRIGYVVHEQLVSDRGEIGVMTDDPLFGHLEIGHRDVRDHFNLALNVTRLHDNGSGSTVLPAACGHDVSSGFLCYEGSIGVN